MSIMKYLIILIINVCLAFTIFAETPPVTPNAQTNSPQKFSSFADIVEPLMPTVVNIYSVHYNKSKHAPLNPFEGFPFDQFNGLFDQFNNGELDELYSNPKAMSLGSGFIIDPTGYIVTNYHVIRNSDEINVKLNDNTELSAKLIGGDHKTDLALLKVEHKKPLPFAKFSDTVKARVGDQVIAIGNPFGLGGTVTTGIISSKGRDLSNVSDDGGVVDDFIQTDAAINNGNSGGPLFNMDGEVIGVNTAIFSPSGSGTNIGIGFAIPSSTTQHIIEQLKLHGRISRGKLDITIQEITNELAEGLGLKEQTGVLVINVSPGGSGDKAGLKSGDIIIAFNGEQVKNSRKLQVLVAEAPINKELKIVIIRNDKKQELITKIIDKEGTKKPQESKENSVDNNSFSISDVTFSNITDDLRQRFNVKETMTGIMVTKIPSPKTQKSYGLKIGDIVLAVNQQPISNITQFKKICDLAKTLQKKNVVLLVRPRYNDLNNVFIALPVT